MTMTQKGFRLTPSETTRLEAYAAKHSTTKSAVIRDWLDDLIENGSDVEPTKIVRILIDPEKGSAAEEAARALGVGLRDVVRHEIARLGK